MTVNPRANVRQSTIEHRLYTDIPSLMHRIAETDDLADVSLGHSQPREPLMSLQKVTASLHAATAEQIPRLRSRLDAIIADGQAQVDQICEPNRPWIPILAEAYPDREFHNSEGWSTIEEWKQEIVRAAARMSLTDRSTFTLQSWSS